MAEFIYIACALISLTCTFLLTKSYLENRARLLLWVAVSFAFLSLNNIFVCVDLLMFPELNLWGSVVRNLLLAIAGSLLAIGLAWELS